MGYLPKTAEFYDIATMSMISLTYDQIGDMDRRHRVFLARFASPGAMQAISCDALASLASRSTIVEDRRMERPVWDAETNRPSEIWFPSMLVLKYRFVETGDLQTTVFAEPDKARGSVVGHEIARITATVTKAITADNSSKVTCRTLRSIEQGVNVWTLQILVEPRGDVLADNPLNNLIASHAQITTLIDFC